MLLILYIMGCLCSKKYKHRKKIEKENKRIQQQRNLIIKTLNLPINELYLLIYEDSCISSYLKGDIMFKCNSNMIYIKSLEINLPIKINQSLKSNLVIAIIPILYTQILFSLPGFLPNLYHYG